MRRGARFLCSKLRELEARYDLAAAVRSISGRLEAFASAVVIRAHESAVAASFGSRLSLAIGRAFRRVGAWNNRNTCE